MSDRSSMRQGYNYLVGIFIKVFFTKIRSNLVNNVEDNESGRLGLLLSLVRSVGVFTKQNLPVSQLAIVTGDSKSAKSKLTHLNGSAK